MVLQTNNINRHCSYTDFLWMIKLNYGQSPKRSSSNIYHFFFLYSGIHLWISTDNSNKNSDLFWHYKTSVSKVLLNSYIIIINRKIYLLTWIIKSHQSCSSKAFSISVFRNYTFVYCDIRSDDNENNFSYSFFNTTKYQ